MMTEANKSNEKSSKKFILLTIGRGRRMFIPLEDTNPPPTFKIIQADVDVVANGFRELFERIDEAEPVEMTTDLYNQVLIGLKNYIDELDEAMSNL